MRFYDWHCELCPEISFSSNSEEMLQKLIRIHMEIHAHDIYRTSYGYAGWYDESILIAAQ